MSNDTTLDLNDPAITNRFHQIVDDLRTTTFFANSTDGRVFFNQTDAAWVMRCVDFRFSFVEIDETSSPYLAEAIKHELLNMHGEPHARLRRLVSAALRDRVEDRLRVQIANTVDRIIDEFPDNGVIDLCADFAEPLPGRVLGPMYGIPYDEAADLNQWIRVGGRKLDALMSGEPIAEIENANRKMHGYLRDLLVERRGDLGTDIFSELILAEVDGDRLTEDELVYLTSELASAGVDTTRDQLPLILLSLFRHPEQLLLLQESPELAMAAVDEGMRFAPLPWLLPHTAVRDVRYNGIDFAEGDVAMISVPAVNRDPSVITEPHRFDITRPRARNFSFGQGAHACPAAQLARVEMAIAVERLIRRVPSMRLVEDPKLESAGKGRIPTAVLVEIAKG